MIASPTTLEVDSKATPASEPGPIEAAPPVARDENLYLIGRPTMKQFIRYVRGHAVNPPGDAILADEWQAANDYVRTLEKEEAGCADNPPISPLEVNAKYEPLLIEFLKDPLVRNSFNTVPTDVAMVELDRLVVYQKHIDLTFVEQLKKKLGPTPSDEEIFRTCLPYDHPQPPVKWSRVHDSFVFVSHSNDLRFLGTMPLKAEHIKDYPPPGNLVGVVGIAVGFGSNFLNAVCAEKRIILNNGSHRAYALREMGFTHVPCIVQHVPSRELLNVVACSDIRHDADFFLKHPRPTMLKDYFNPKLRKVMPVHRRLHQVTVRFEVDESYLPAV